MKHYTRGDDDDILSAKLTAATLEVYYAASV